MKELDASKGAGQLLRLAIICSLITKKALSLKNICSSYNPPGLNQSKLEILNKLEDLGIAKVKGAGIGSSNVVIIPTKKELPKNVVLDLKRPSSTILALDGLLLPFIFSDKRTTIIIKGTTHGNRSPPVSFYKETYWRYLKPYLDYGDLNASKLGCYPEIGELTVKFQGLGRLTNQTPKLIITKKPELVAIKADLINNSQEYLQRTEKLLRLAFTSKQVPFTITTRISSNEVTALSLIAFFGDFEGYDNDKPFIKGTDILRNGELTEKQILELSKSFQSELLNPYLDEHTADLLIPLLAFVGGSLPISQLSSHMEAAIPILEDILDVEFTFQENTLSCNGYARLLDNDLPSIDDL